MKTDHIIINMNTGCIECTRCKESWHINAMLPAPLPVYVAAVEEWARLHQDCIAPDAPSQT